MDCMPVCVMYEPCVCKGQRKSDPLEVILCLFVLLRQGFNV